MADNQERIYMAFDKLREGRPVRSSNCHYCGKKDKDGVVQLAIKDGETKTVVSRTVGACENCAEKVYGDALKVVSPAPATAT